MATALSINRYFINDYIKASRFFTYKKLIELMHIISSMDCRVKNINYGSSNNLNIFADLSVKLFETHNQYQTNYIYMVLLETDLNFFTDV